MRTIALLFLAAGVSGCADFWLANQQNPKPTLPPYDPAEYQPYLQPGTGSISGQAFLVTKSGDAKRAAGKAVTLDPLTRLARAWWNGAKAYERLEPRLPDDPRVLAARKTTTADADGKFLFEGLPAGDYLVRTTLQWQAQQCIGYSGCGEQSGVVGGPVHLNAGEKKTNVNFGADAVLLPEGTAHH